MNPRILFATTAAVIALSFPALAADAPSCADLPNHEALMTALKAARAQDNGGLNLDM